MRMRLLIIAGSVLVACSNPSKLDVDRSADVDALWALAPDGTQLGMVASPRAVGLALRGVSALRELATQPDLEPVRGQLELLARGLFGTTEGSPADAGFAELGFAMFATGDGIIGVMPVADRDKFMTSKHGQRGSAEDTIEGNICREIDRRYVCATDAAMFARLGKGSLRGQVKAGARGDAEVYMKQFPLLGESGELALAAQLEVGQISVHARWNGTPSPALVALARTAAPRTDVARASGFATIDMAPLLADAPAVPLVENVTFAQLATAMRGPVSAVIPSGSVDIQVSAPLSDATPAQSIVDKCVDLGRIFTLAAQQQPGACRMVMQGTTALELDLWVDGTTLRLGAHKGAPAAGDTRGPTAIGRELAQGSWTAAFWGRGTMLNLSGVAPAEAAPSSEVSLGIHAISLINEVGAAIRVDDHGVVFRGFMRTAWANPPEVVAAVTAIPGSEIVMGQATARGAAIAAASPGSPFAADFAAGQGGLMVPAAVLGVVSTVVIPLIASALTPSL